MSSDTPNLHAKRTTRVRARVRLAWAEATPRERSWTFFFVACAVMAFTNHGTESAVWVVAMLVCILALEHQEDS